MTDRRRTRFVAVLALAGVSGLGALVLGAPAARAAQSDRPDFQLPFECGQEWRLDSWGHAPALDMVREPDQHGTEGALLVAPADGVVNRSFRHDNAGEVIQIDHGGGWFTTYLHLQSRSVSEGDQVGQGDEIGRVGRSGPTSNNHPHLHFELAVDADGDGSATWGFEGAERVRPWFAGTEYGQSNNETWRNVASGNCGEPAPPPPPPTTAAPTTTAPPATTTTSTTSTTVAPTTTSSTTTSTTSTTVPPTTTTTASPSGGLPLTGSSGTTIAGVVGAVLLAAGTGLVVLRRRLAT